MPEEEKLSDISIVGQTVAQIDNIQYLFNNFLFQWNTLLLKSRNNSRNLSKLLDITHLFYFLIRSSLKKANNKRMKIMDELLGIKEENGIIRIDPDFNITDQTKAKEIIANLIDVATRELGLMLLTETTLSGIYYDKSTIKEEGVFE